MFELTVKGMTCGGCVRAVERAVGKVHGVEEVKVTLDDGRVEVRGDADRQSVERAVKDAGYEVVG